LKSGIGSEPAEKTRKDLFGKPNRSHAHRKEVKKLPFFRKEGGGGQKGLGTKFSVGLAPVDAR